MAGSGGCRPREVGAVESLRQAATRVRPGETLHESTQRGGRLVRGGGWCVGELVRGAEKALNRATVKAVSQRGWVPAISGYTGYGSESTIRIYGRILAVDPTRSSQHDPDDKTAQRGWRQFLTVQLTDHP